MRYVTYNKLHMLKVHNLVKSGLCTHLWDQYHNQGSERIHHPQDPMPLCLCSSPLLSSSPPQATTICFLSQTSFYFLEAIHVDSRVCAFFCLFSFSIFLGSSLLLYIPESIPFHCWVVSHCMAGQFVHSPVDGHLSCFQYGAVANKAACIQVFVWTYIYFSLRQRLRSRMPGSYGRYIFN